MKHKLLLAVLASFALMSCSNDGWLTKKFVKRLNAEEYASASKYIYPSDRPALFFFINEVLKKSPDSQFEILQKENAILNGQNAVIVQFKCSNPSVLLKKYMDQIHKPLNDGIFTDTLYIKESKDGDVLGFNWGLTNKDSAYYQAAKIGKEDVEAMNIRSGPGKQFPAVRKLHKNEDIIIRNEGEDHTWAECYYVNDQGQVKPGYLYAKLLESRDTVFFHLGIFEGMSLLVALLVLAIIMIPLFLLSGIVQALFSSPVGGFIAVGIILLLIYSIYQLLENILFELLMINLPY